MTTSGLPGHRARCRAAGPGAASLLLALGGLALALVAPLAAPAEARARAQGRETQVALLPGEGVVELSPDLRRRLGLFPEIAEPAAVRLFQGAGGAYVLEVEIRDGAMLARERRPLTAVELEGLRSDLSGRLRQAGLAGNAQPSSREGRGGLVLGETLLGLGFYGWAVPVTLNLESGQSYVAAYLLTSGLSFLVPYRLTRSGEVSPAHRTLTLYGGTRGIAYGALLADALAGDADEADRVRMGASLLGSVGGSILGFRAAGRLRPDEGRAALWAAMGDIGLGMGAGLALLAGPYTARVVEEEPFLREELRNRELGHALTLGGGLAGLFAGHWLGEREEYTRGNVNALQSSVVLGAQTGLALAIASGSENERVAAASILAGAGAGLVLGNGVLRGKRFTAGEGLLVNAGHLAGGLGALGLTYLAVDGFSDRETLYMTTSTIGSALGAGLVFRALGLGSER